MAAVQFLFHDEERQWQDVSGEEEVNVDTRQRSNKVRTTEAEKRIAILKNGKEFSCICLRYLISPS